MALSRFSVHSYLPILADYVDRALVFRELSGYADSVTLVTYDGADSGLELIRDHFRIEEVDGLTGRLRMATMAIRQARASGAPCIIHETFLGPTFSAARLLDRRQAHHRRVLSLYFPVSVYFFRFGWRGTKTGLSLQEWWHHLVKYGKLTALELVSSRLADMIICNSDEIRQGVERFYAVPASKTVVMPTAVDTEH